MTVMETTTCFGLYWPSSGCLGNLRASYMYARARGVEWHTEYLWTADRRYSSGLSVGCQSHTVSQ